jgi:AbiV family abortive infection protein
MVTLRKLSNMAVSSFKNGLQLHFDSILLFKNGSYASAVLLSVLSMEEFGKYFSLSSYVFYSGTSGNRRDEEFLELLYNHPFKQSACFGRDGFELPEKTKMFDKAKSRYFENLKQRSVYVGFKREKGQILSEEIINNPKKITKSQAYNQLKFLNDLMINLTDDHLKGITLFDEEEINEILCDNLRTKLKKLFKNTVPNMPA